MYKQGECIIVVHNGLKIVTPFKDRIGVHFV